MFSSHDYLVRVRTSKLCQSLTTFIKTDLSQGERKCKWNGWEGISDVLCADRLLTDPMHRQLQPLTEILFSLHIEAILQSQQWRVASGSNDVVCRIFTSNTNYFSIL